MCVCVCEHRKFFDHRFMYTLVLFMRVFVVPYFNNILYRSIGIEYYSCIARYRETPSSPHSVVVQQKTWKIINNISIKNIIGTSHMLLHKIINKPLGKLTNILSKMDTSASALANSSHSHAITSVKIYVVHVTHLLKLPKQSNRSYWVAG